MVDVVKATQEEVRSIHKAVNELLASASISSRVQTLINELFDKAASTAVAPEPVPESTLADVPTPAATKPKFADDSQPKIPASSAPALASSKLDP